jgi:hypothetical protein
MDWSYVKSDSGSAGAGTGGKVRSLGIKSSIVGRCFVSITPAENLLFGGHATLDGGE